MSDTPTLPTGARVLVGAVVLAGAATLAVRAGQVGGWRSTDLLAFVLIAAAVAIAECFPIELTYSNEKVTYSLSDAVWTAALLTSPASVLTLAVAGGVLVGQSVQTWAPLKVAFNVSQFAIGITAAVVVFDALDPPTAAEPAAWLAAAAAMAVFQAVNTGLMGAIISFTEHQPFWRVALVPTGVLHWVGNISIGVLAALVWHAEPYGLPLLLVPMVLTYFAYRGWLTTVQERDQMREMATAADGISESGDLARRVPELGDRTAAAALASTLNRMLDRLDASFRRERLFISQTSHELRTPITICLGHIDVLGDDPSREELDDAIAVVVDELGRMSRIVADMTTLARMEDPLSLHLEQVPVERLVSDVATKATTLLNGQLHTSAPDCGSINADPQRLTQALINLLQNAAEHTPAGTAVHLRASRDSRAWRFEVADEGPGLPPGNEEKVFRPFFTDKTSVGNGLGLVIVAGIARAHGGTAGVDNQPGQGATFWVEIPR